MTSRPLNVILMLLMGMALAAAAGPGRLRQAEGTVGEDLPPCRTGTAAPSHPPAGVPGFDASDACRSRATRVESVARAVPGPLRAEPSTGYHHLGGTTRDGYSGVLGRIEVRDTGVRSGTFDFVATRFMAKSFLADGAMAWLEAGWSETGWSVPPKPHVYTYDTNSGAWSFYDQYQLADGGRVWIYLQAQPPGNAAGPQWQAWLWWSDGWHLLTAQTLPVPANAQIEQYVEVHTDPKQPGTVAVPAVSVDSVRLREPSGGLRYWQPDVLTSTSDGGAAGYCVSWTTRYDTWSAGTC